ncbi:cytochrome c [Chitinophaga silvatica]|uniref:Cytochrome c n=1 Tax=Chitinophaga silvatica TaxID=2282649 RepID=A0A3E1Y2R8_9BACT|nr:cytochrome c [Chitinophaga silvatica]RFS19000.1 cytochrome c [Chitinophaga silvatica]
MFSKILKWAGIVLASLLVIGAITYSVLAYKFNQKVNNTYAVNVRPIQVGTDSATIANGKHLYEIKGCGECHAADLGGKVFVNDPAIGTIGGSNLTYGKNGLPESFDDKAWLSALRHGLNVENKSLLLMPSEDYYRMDDEDISAIIAFCKSQPYVDRPSPEIVIKPMGKILAVLGKLPLFPADIIDHQHQQPAVVEKTASVSYGKYLSASCTGCHKTTLTGGENPVPGGATVANITSSGHIGKWSKDEFITALRTGNTPEGKALKNEDMPWQMTAKYTDVELEALYLYLKSL